MEFRVLGAIEVADGERLLPLGGPKPRALLAHLLVEADHIVPRDRLVDELWGDDPPTTAQDTLNVHIAALRKVLGSRLRTEANGYLLQASPDEVDASRFEAAATATRAHLDDPAAVAAALNRALGLWRGPVFGGIQVGRTAAAAAARLEELRLGVIEDRVEADLAMGLHAGLVAELTGLVVASPSRERATGQLMLALHRCGRSADALTVYSALCSALDEQLGVDPSDALVALSRAIHRADPTLTTPGPPSLPTFVSRFVGRAAELVQGGTLLATSRLLTLTGSGGSGKSRLAVELARAAAATHPDGVHMVSLATLMPNGSVTREVARVLGVRERTGEPLATSLAGWLRHRRCLIVLDNCEHLVSACADLCTSLLEAAPGLRILATSRESLGIGGEVVFAIAGLRVPRRDDPVDTVEAADAVRLLRDRAAAVRPGFAFGPGDAAMAAAICNQLDGLPLAIELAATQLRSMSLSELAARVDERLDVIGGSRAGHAHHRTMRAAIQWSYELLDDAERAVLRRLSVFIGGLTADAAQAVIEDWEPLAKGVDIREVCARLVNKSMVLAEPGSGTTRYSMLEVVRQFAAGRLADAGEEATARARHAAWYHGLIPEVAVWGGPDQAAWIERLAPEVANVRAALSWFLGDAWEPVRAVEMVGRLWWFWYMQGLLGEGRGWFGRALAATSGEPTAERALALRGAAATARIVGDFSEAIRLGMESLALCRTLDDDRGAAAALNNLCISAIMSGDLNAARGFGEESLEVIRQLGDSQGLANSHNNLGIVARNVGDLGRAAELFASARDGYRGGDNRRGLAAALTNLAILSRRTGEPATARGLAIDALRLYADLGFDEGKLDCIEVVAALDAAEGHAAPALRMLSAVSRRRAELGAPLFVPDEIQQCADAESVARTVLGSANAERVVEEAQSLTIDAICGELLASVSAHGASDSPGRRSSSWR